MGHRATAVAGRAVELAIREGVFTAEDVRRGLDEPPSQSTVTRVLRQLEADDWLERTAETSSLWRAGPTARLLGDMDQRAREAAERPAVQLGEETHAPDLDVFPDR